MRTDRLMEEGLVLFSTRLQSELKLPPEDADKLVRDYFSIVIMSFSIAGGVNIGPIQLRHSASGKSSVRLSDSTREMWSGQQRRRDRSEITDAMRERFRGSQLHKERLLDPDFTDYTVNDNRPTLNAKDRRDHD